MNLKLKIGQGINAAIDWLARLNIKMVAFVPGGRLVVVDLKRAGITIDTIFDVGANVGQTALLFNRHFPAARIYCFEPVVSVYNELLKNTMPANITCINCALGQTKGELIIYKSPNHDHISSINGQTHNDLVDEETIKVDTGADVLAEFQLTQIDLLKIDTEGYEMEVLAGFGSLLEKSVKSIYVEVGFHRQDPCKTHIADLLSFLDAHGFIASGLYDSYKTGPGKLKLNHSDLLLINTNLVDV